MSAALLDIRLRQMRLEAEGIVSYEFVPANDDASLPPFSAGAHIDLHLPGNLIRSYSLVNAPSDTGRYLIAVRHEPSGRGGSAWLHTVPRVGDVFRVSLPINSFPVVEGAELSVFIAGGIGITPVMSMLARLSALGRPWLLHYATRGPRQTAFLDKLTRMAGPSRDVRFCFGSSRRARLDIARIVREAPVGAHLYCCGPDGMIETFLAACAGRPPSTVHVERFSAGAPRAADGGFDIVLARRGKRLTVAPGRSILDTLLDHAIDVPYACTAGVCGTCRTAVLDGEPDHRDAYLSPEEKRLNDSIMICCSRARSPVLVLDL